MGCLGSTLHDDTVISVSLPHQSSPGETIVLTRNDVKVIRSDLRWLVSHHRWHGVVENMYLRMVLMEPSTKLTFLKYGQLRGDELVRNSFFQRNVNVFGESLIKIIGLLSNVPALLTFIDELGLLHRSLSTMKYEHIGAFEGAMKTILEMQLAPRLGVGRKKNVENQTVSQNAWRKLFRLISQRLYNAYNN